MRESILHKVTKYTLLAVLMGFTLFPLLWLVDTTLKPNEEMFASIPKWWIDDMTLDHYKWALEGRGIAIFDLLKNSIIVCLITALCTGLVACFSGYGLARYKVPGIGFVIVLLILGQMIQGPLIMIPWYKFASTTHLLDTKIVLVMIYNTLTIPVGVWIMSGFFKVIPKELEEAAYIDGAGKVRTLFTIMIPMAIPGLVAISLYAFILGWNDYQYSLILTSTLSSKTIQVGIAELMGSLGAQNWGGLMASGVIAILPVVIIFSAIQKLLIEGLTAGSVKG